MAVVGEEEKRADGAARAGLGRGGAGGPAIGVGDVFEDWDGEHGNLAVGCRWRGQIGEDAGAEELGVKKFGKGGVRGQGADGGKEGGVGIVAEEVAEA